MIYRYDIKKYNGRDVLYLYLTMNEEFSAELGDKNSDTLENKCKKYIKSKNIPYQGEDIFLVVNGIVVKSLNIKNKDINIEILDDKCDYINAKYKVKVQDGKSKETVALKDFLVGVLFSNCSYDMELEVLKAVCVLYRTYIFYLMEKDGVVPVSDEFIHYRSISYYKLALIEHYQDFYKKVEQAVDYTDCIFITYHNQYIKPYIHHTNNGFTEESLEVPYLEKKYSLWDFLSPMYLDIKEFSYDQLENVLNATKHDLQNFQITELTPGNKISKIKIGPILYTGEELRKKLGLHSTDITILINDLSVKFITRGYGHGLGLSISGATELTRSSCSYLQILNYYFSKCTIKKYV